MENNLQNIHGTTVQIEDYGVLLLGVAGAGKSDLALRLIDHGAQLVADDQTILTLHKGLLWASSPEKLQGLLEIRHVGIHQLPFVETSPLALAINLCQDPAERLPEDQTISYLSIDLPLYHLNPFEASTPAKIRILVEHISRAKNAA
ncbi:HPr kinase/phosphatase C-terminal domain-containing protein [Candidatus Bealeia paramacronuclearis]|uniref:HPr kinase/phosphatase C-terminal domain-containing protein n=1 Tax=Candidatus Bealeia paramacronuclearis TaxID=1921001 RepID=A0ABZ2C3N4_9PROT|nr:hypothetical protein [Candidatus Bealeia paramacronuclearis]